MKCHHKGFGQAYSTMKKEGREYYQKFGKKSLNRYKTRPLLCCKAIIFIDLCKYRQWKEKHVPAAYQNECHFWSWRL